MPRPPLSEAKEYYDKLGKHIDDAHNHIDHLEHRLRKAEAELALNNEYQHMVDRLDARARANEAERDRVYYANKIKEWEEREAREEQLYLAARSARKARLERELGWKLDWEIVSSPGMRPWSF
ncbi:hypothetical protein P280DRAFT_470297 [Massarina eburnea CBS 473.64]|uniref:Uncharacterized protein n=1 Tax=Massarina eburnea CBS 473.64 TaxID=1395130 RepID=A0A6A6RWE9_9PLEO|nr:hypothetical protein P280DRAFT_470297 [Massarina eburnea CBS 473.64]